MLKSFIKFSFSATCLVMIKFSNIMLLATFSSKAFQIAQIFYQQILFFPLFFVVRKENTVKSNKNIKIKKENAEKVH